MRMIGTFVAAVVAAVVAAAVPTLDVVRTSVPAVVAAAAAKLLHHPDRSAWFSFATVTI